MISDSLLLCFYQAFITLPKQHLCLQSVHNGLHVCASVLLDKTKHESHCFLDLARGFFSTKVFCFFCGYHHHPEQDHRFAHISTYPSNLYTVWALQIQMIAYLQVFSFSIRNLKYVQCQSGDFKPLFYTYGDSELFHFQIDMYFNKILKKFLQFTK